MSHHRVIKSALITMGFRGPVVQIHSPRPLKIKGLAVSGRLFFFIFMVIVTICDRFIFGGGKTVKQTFHSSQATHRLHPQQSLS
jgi:hypothetical protein